jgi:hypothetical protein
MKIICPIRELWLVEPIIEHGLISYWCERCANYPSEHSGIPDHFTLRKESWLVSLSADSSAYERYDSRNGDYKSK